MHGNTTHSIELSHDFCTVVACKECRGEAHLVAIANGMCPIYETMVEIREFYCRACLNRTWLKLPV
jgi:hypothetical protein